MRVPHVQMARAGREAGRAGGGVDALLPLRFGVEVCFGFFSALLLAGAPEDVEPPPVFALAGKTGAGRQTVDLCSHGGWQAVNPGLDEGLGGGWRRGLPLLASFLTSGHGGSGGWSGGVVAVIMAE